MATIRKRRNKWNVQIRRSQHKPLSRTFLLKSDAVQWARTTEIALDRGDFIDPACPELRTLACILIRYRDDIASRRKSAGVDLYVINAMLRHDLASFPLDQIQPYHFASYRDERLKAVTGSTVNREISLCRQAFDYGIKEWGLRLTENPLASIKPARINPSRNRRLKPGEFEAITHYPPGQHGFWFTAIVAVAVETGMRRGELLGLHWQDVNLNKRTCYLATTKNGTSRTVPLSLKAIEILDSLPRDISGRVFAISDMALKKRWLQACSQSGITDLRFHDLRHEATSRFFEKGLNVMEVAAITGHKDLRMLKRYTHLRAEDLAVKLG